MKRLEFYKNVSDAAFDKIKQEKGDLITFCLNELEGCEKLYGLMFIFTQFGELEQEQKDLITNSSVIIIGDLMEQDDDFKKRIVDNIIDQFYSFDKLKDGYLVMHQFEEMEEYLKKRKSDGFKGYNVILN